MPKRVTLKQVAAQARVSFQTVSKVLNGQAQVSEETRERIWRAVRTLEYRPDVQARNLRTHHSRMIGYSWTRLPLDQPNPILDQFLQSMIETAAQSGYHILPFLPPEGGDELCTFRELVNAGHVDGFVFSSIRTADPRINFLLAQSFPFVAFGRLGPESDFPFVDVDGAAGLRMATEHLIEHGHTRIAALAWPEDSCVGQDRLGGYLQALDAAHISPREDWICRGAGSAAFGYHATRRWLHCPAPERPTAIVALNDMLAIGAMHAAKEHGLRIGKDLAITGFDDVPLVQYLTPPLTSVRQPIWQVGQHVIELLTEILAGGIPSDPHVLLEPQLIIRESSWPHQEPPEEGLGAGMS
jgi:DNA-binding LacI/PurR family transcriptional regulator